ncbi:MAG: TIGR00366 family protein [Xanthomonadales bacterium]|nr:TIGR00366 family protein [Xanthomonadales bacterium]
MLDRIRVPHTLVLLFAIMVLAWVATWLLPQGRFERTVPEGGGHAVVVPGSYAPLAEPVRLGPSVLLTAVPRAMADAREIIFFVLLVGGAIGVLRATGVIDAALGAVLRRTRGRPFWLIAGGVTAFAAASSAIGVAEEYIPLMVILIGLCAAMRLDTVTAVAIVVVGYGIGYGAAALNPFTVQVAQNVAGLQPVSGWEFRLALFLPFVAIGVHHVWSYARRVAADPGASLLAGLPAAEPPLPEPVPVDRRRALVLLLTLGALGLMVWGITARGWYLVELSALFLGLGLLAGLLGGLGADATARRFTEGAAELAGTALLIGFARAIALVLEEGQVLDTIVHGLSQPLSALGSYGAAIGMLLIQTLINFFIPSGSGQAYATMPIMAPLADVVGIERQVAVLAFQFGDGFANMIVPTNVVLMSILGIAGIPFDRWLRFVAPLMLKLILASAAALAVAVAIGYR